jgi:hypothetical protein
VERGTSLETIRQEAPTYRGTRPNRLDRDSDACERPAGRVRDWAADQQVRQVVGGRGARAPPVPGAEAVAELGDYERAHQNRVAVVSEIDARLGIAPWPGYDELDVDGVRFGLDGARRDRFVAVLAYERAHRNRAGVVLAAQQRLT